MVELIHVTAHLGGGVGRVLSRVVEATAGLNAGMKHVVVCLERPEKLSEAAKIEHFGGELLLCPSHEELDERIVKADLVQIEWWHHPVVAGWMCRGVLPPMRLIIWSHVSGLHPPEILPEFVGVPHRFLFSSDCSWEHPSLAACRSRLQERVGVVYSSGGFEDRIPSWAPREKANLRAGYLGTLNFAKLHPQVLDFIEAVRLPNFKLEMVGDPTTGPALMAQAKSRGVESRLELRGYQSDVAREFARWDVLAYLLNPLHYGTTENALLEAMAMGVVPIVLNNPAERCLIANGETGLIVDTPAAFADAMEWLANNPRERSRLSATARRHVRKRFSIKCTAAGLNDHYRRVLAEEKRAFDFRPIFGDEPADWFRSCQGVEAWRFQPGGEMVVSSSGRGPEFLYERTKGSVFHYRSVYPTDGRLSHWAYDLENAA